MADRSTIARPYAKAAFADAKSADALDAWSTLLDRGAAVVSDARVAALIGSPKVTPAQLAELVTEVAGTTGTGEAGQQLPAPAGRQPPSRIPPRDRARGSRR